MPQHCPPHGGSLPQSFLSAWRCSVKSKAELSVTAVGLRLLVSLSQSLTSGVMGISAS